MTLETPLFGYSPLFSEKSKLSTADVVIFFHVPASRALYSLIELFGEPAIAL